MLLQEQQRQTEIQRQHVTSQVGEVRALLETELNSTLHLTSGLITYIQARRGRLQATEVDPWLRGLIKQGRHIRNIGIAPGNRITYIYPLVGNESALGLYYPNNPAQWPEVERVMRTRQPVLAGPLQLKQGGSGLIYRVPVFLEDGRYWGILSTVINADQLLASPIQAAKDRNLEMTLARLDPQGAIEQMIVGDQARHAQAFAHSQVILPGGPWQLGATPLHTESSIEFASWKRMIGWALSVTLATLIFLLFRAHTRRAGMLKALADSQQRFTRAFETAPQGMALLDWQGRWLDANTALCQLLGYTRNELSEKYFGTLLHRDDPQQGNNMDINTLLAGGDRCANLEIRLLSKSGDPIDCLLSLAAVDANPPYFIAQIQDNREYKRLERMKSDFISAVSHELRTPLTSIAGALGLIVGGVLGETTQQIRQMLEIAHKNSLRLGLLINDLLDMDKLVAGKMNFELKTQPLQPLLEEAVTSNRSYAEKYGINLQLHGDATVQVRVDGLRLQQVLANFLSNAAKYSPSGSTVIVNVGCNDTHVRVSVIDTGAGIPEAFKDRIFQKFSQADSSDARARGGTGLGLAISRELIQRMAGSVGFQSQTGVGSTFWFELPRHWR